MRRAGRSRLMHSRSKKFFLFPIFYGRGGFFRCLSRPKRLRFRPSPSSPTTSGNSPRASTTSPSSRSARHSREMDRANVMDPDLIRKFFDLDLMGIEIPEEFGGLGANFTTSIAIIEALARVDAACAVVVDVQNTLVNNAILRWASPGPPEEVLPAAREAEGRLVRAVGGRLGLRRVRARDDGDAEGRPLAPERRQALDHERPRGRAVPRLRERRQEQGLQGHHGFLRRVAVEGLPQGQEGGQARNPRVLHARARVRGPRGAGGERRRQRRRGLQDRDRDAERGPHRDRRADGRDRARRARLHDEVREGAPAVRPASRAVPGRPARARAHGHGARVRAPRRLQRGAPQGGRPAVRARRPRSRSSRAPRSPRCARRAASSSSAATAT